MKNPIDYLFINQAARPAPQKKDPFNPNLMGDGEGNFWESNPDETLGNQNMRLADMVSKARFQDTLDRMNKPKGHGLNLPSNVLPDRGWDAVFGGLQAKQHGIEAQGKKFEADLVGKGPGTVTGLGTWKALDVPSGRVYNQHTSNRQSDEGAHVPISQIAPGRRGRENMGLAELQGLDPSQGGYYTPDEHNAMTGRKWSPLTMLQGLFRR